MNLAGHGPKSGPAKARGLSDSSLPFSIDRPALSAEKPLHEAATDRASSLGRSLIFVSASHQTGLDIMSMT